VIQTLAVLLCACAAPAEEPDPPPPAIGALVPSVELFDLHGRRFRLQEVREPVIVLNFFAFWCDTWIAELPQLRELAAEQKPLNFRLLAVNVDGKWTDQLQAVCGDDPPPYPVLVDRGKRLSQSLGVRRIPTIVVLNRERRVASVFEAHPGNPALLEAIREAASTATPEPRRH
jgi:thiol-disulfide isomerase/thioredoxin